MNSFLIAVDEVVRISGTEVIIKICSSRLDPSNVVFHKFQKLIFQFILFIKWLKKLNLRVYNKKRIEFKNNYILLVIKTVFQSNQTGINSSNASEFRDLINKFMSISKIKPTGNKVRCWH